MSQFRCKDNMYFQYYKTNNGKRMVNFSTCLKFNYHYAIYYHFIITFADKKRERWM